MQNFIYIMTLRAQLLKKNRNFITYLMSWRNTNTEQAGESNSQSTGVEQFKEENVVIRKH